MDTVKFSAPAWWTGLTGPTQAALKNTALYGGGGALVGAGALAALRASRPKEDEDKDINRSRAIVNQALLGALMGGAAGTGAAWLPNAFAAPKSRGLNRLFSALTNPIASGVAKQPGATAGALTAGGIAAGRVPRQKYMEMLSDKLYKSRLDTISARGGDIVDPLTANEGKFVDAWDAFKQKRYGTSNYAKPTIPIHKRLLEKLKPWPMHSEGRDELSLARKLQATIGSEKKPPLSRFAGKMNPKGVIGSGIAGGLLGKLIEGIVVGGG